MSILAKDLPFLESYPVIEKISKKVQKVVFPNPVQFGVGNFTTASLQFSGSLYFNIAGTNTYEMSPSALKPLSGNPDLGSSLSEWGTIYASNIQSTTGSFTHLTGVNALVTHLTGTNILGTDATITTLDGTTANITTVNATTVSAASGSFTDQIDGKIKAYFPFHFLSTDTGRIYIPWYSLAENTVITDPDVRLVVVRPGKVNRVALRSDVSIGTTIISFHRNQSTTIIVSDSSAITAGDRDVFDFGDAATFVAGDQIHIGIDPTTAGSQYNGMIEIEFDTNGSVGI